MHQVGSGHLWSGDGCPRRDFKAPFNRRRGPCTEGQGCAVRTRLQSVRACRKSSCLPAVPTASDVPPLPHSLFLPSSLLLFSSLPFFPFSPAARELWGSVTSFQNFDSPPAAEAGAGMSASATAAADAAAGGGTVKRWSSRHSWDSLSSSSESREALGCAAPHHRMA